MKTVDVADATASLASYGRGKKRETWLLTRRGKPVAAVVPLDHDDAIGLGLANDRAFIEMIERSRISAAAEGTVSLAEAERQLDIKLTTKRPRRKA